MYISWTFCNRGFSCHPIYLIGFVILLVIGTIFSLLLKSIPLEDDMESIEENEELDQKSKNNTILVTTLFALLAGFWCIGWGGFTELAPLISNKIGYLESVYTILEIILLCIISCFHTKISQIYLKFCGICRNFLD